MGSDPETRLTESIKAVLLVGDHEQLPPLVLGNECNEFRKQMEFSLLQRLLAYGFPSHMLRTQHRMHTAIAEFPMLYTYKGLVTNGGREYIYIYRSVLWIPSSRRSSKRPPVRYWIRDYV